MFDFFKQKLFYTVEERATYRNVPVSAAYDNYSQKSEIVREEDSTYQPPKNERPALPPPKDRFPY